MLTKSISDSFRTHSRYHLEKTMLPKLNKYFQTVVANENSNLIQLNKMGELSDFDRIGGGLSNDVYSFSISYPNSKITNPRNAILKTYIENIDPYNLIRKTYAYNKDICRCQREFEILKLLNSLHFPAPEVYVYETDSSFLGYPFIIMKQENVAKTSLTTIIDCFAKTLADLHNLNLSKFDVTFLRVPKDKYDFARSWPLHFKKLLNIMPKHNQKTKEYLKIAIRYLDSIATKNYCPQYCIVHGDYHPGNVCMTKDSRFLILDWDSIEIGDPALDVGYAYHFIKFFTNPRNPNAGESVAQRFLSVYNDNFSGDISSRLEFYKTVGILGPTIFYSSGLSSPVYALKFHRRNFLQAFTTFNGPLMLFAFPFIKWSFVAQQFGAEVDLLWLNYYYQFMKQSKFAEIC
jgi:aminoglycoside phosphotransferase (APT) family kinase protein